MRRPIRLTVALALLAAAPAFADPAPVTADETPVRVERVKPKRPKHESLRFLKANRDFIRLCLDRTREKSLERPAGDGTVDPRFLEYRRLVADAHAGRDSAAAADEARRRQTLLASVTELGGLEQQIDQLDRLLAAQRARLEQIERDFTGDQRTALAVVLSGWPSAGALEQVALTLEDGSTVTVPLDDAQRTALQQGGAVQVFHGFVEPREQLVQVTLQGAAWPHGDSGWLALEPARDRLTLLRLDLAPIAPGQGAPALAAATWLNDPAR